MKKYSLKTVDSLALIPIVFLIVQAADLIPALMTPLSLFVMVMSVVLNAYALLLAGPLSKGLWSAYIRMPVVVTWIALGLEPAMTVAIGGAVLVTLIRIALNTPLPQPLHELAGRISISGLALIAMHMVNTAIHSGPIINLQRPFYDLPSLISGLLVSLLVTHTVGLLVSGRSPRAHLRPMLLEIPLDSTLMILAGVLPLVLQLISPFAFIVVNVLSIIQVTRYNRMQQTHERLQQRIDEIRLLNELGQLIATNPNLDHILNSADRTLQQLISAPVFIVALYEQEQDRISYPLVRRDAQTEHWDEHSSGSGLIDYVIREKRSISLNRNEGMRMLQMGIEPQSVREAAYLCAPLMVNEQTIGALCLAHPDQPEHFQAGDRVLIEAVASNVSLAIRNVIVFERTRRLTVNLAAINREIQKVMFNLDQEEALRTACKLACEVAGSRAAAIYTLTAQTDRNLNIRQVFGLELMSLPAVLTLDIETAAPSTRPQRQISPEWQAFLHEHGLHSLTQIPLRNGYAVTGLLVLFHDHSTTYESTEMNLLETLANQIGASLDNVILLQALELYNTEQSQLLHLASISSSNLDLDRILLDICHVLGEMIEMPHVEIALMMPAGQQVRLYGVAENSDQLRQESIDLHDLPELAAALQSNSGANQIYTFVNEADQAISSSLRGWMEARNAAVLALIPMKNAAGAIGAIVVSSEEPHAISERTRRVLEMAAYQIKAQIDNARIHATTEIDLQQRLSELSLIEDIATRIAQSLDLHTVIRYVLEAAMRATQSTLASITLRSAAGEHPYLTLWGEQLDDRLNVQHNTVNSVTGITTEVMRSGDLRLISDNQQVPQYYALPGTKQLYASSLAVPLIKSDQIIGVLNVENVRPNHFTADHVRFVQSLAGHAAISIDNANLLDDREYQIKTLSLLRTMALQTLNVIRESEVAAHILQITLTLLNASHGALYRTDRTSSFRLLNGAKVVNAKVEQAELKVPALLLERACSSGVLQIVSDTTTSEVFRMAGYSNPDEYRSMVIIPIRRRGAIYELLTVGFPDNRQFSSREISTFDVLAVQIASHLENTALNATIQDSNDQMRAILDANLDGIILLDAALRVQDANAAAEMLLELPLRERKESGFSALLHSSPTQGAEKLIPLLEQSIDQLDGYQLTTQNKETIRHLTTRVYAVQNSGASGGHVLVLRDVTAERNIARFREKIQSMVLHDLRSPLSAIISSIYLAINILQAPDETDTVESVIPTLQISLESAGHLVQMVETLRDLPVLAEMTITPSQATLKELATEAINSLASTLKEANIEVIYRLPADLPALWVDTDLVRRVFINLLHNAFKFTPVNGSIMIYASTENAPAGYLYVSISDTGPGIPDSQRERIFQEFVQIEGRRPRAGGRGIGLGLNFCKLAVEAHGGRIWVEQQSPLSGACFAFYLPYQQQSNGH